ncbi:MAG: hypothetical protein J0L97_03840 [Alphaproteobacteria bacterium]|nr:hypothetical protein [Alphaproteobacteria bacterium]
MSGFVEEPGIVRVEAWIPGQGSLPKPLVSDSPMPGMTEGGNTMMRVLGDVAIAMVIDKQEGRG